MILKLKPYFEVKPWASKDINNYFDCPIGTGEAWIASGYKGKPSIILNGEYKGESLRHLWSKHPELFNNINEKEFPILLKIIASSDDLSVQVHPNDSYALAKHNSLGKYECWYILKENKSNSLIAGISSKTNIETKELINTGLLQNKLIKRNIEPNNLVFIEPGTVHALTKDSFVLEVQESSDITYRLYDYDRIPKRELHIEDALNVIKYNDERNIIYHLNKNDYFTSKYFDIYKFEFTSNFEYENDSFYILTVIDGCLEIADLKLNKFDTAVITSNSGKITLNGNASILIILPKEKAKERGRMRKVALITGIASQDGSYLMEFLLQKNYDVHGIINTKNLLNKPYFKKYINDNSIMNQRLFFHLGDMTDSSNLNRILEKIRPDEIYHLASQSHVDVSYEMPEYTADVNAMGTLRLVDAIKQNDLRTRLFNESTSQLFGGNSRNALQDENTKFEPQNPYATSKLYSHFIVKNYRDAYGIYAVNGIMFTHSSPREDDTFVGRKITKAVAKIFLGKQEVLKIGNIYAKRDWGYAPNYVEGMWLSLQVDQPSDYIFASGETHTIKEFIEEAFKCINVNLIWQGENINEVGIDKATKKVLVKVDPSLYRVVETNSLCGNSNKAKSQLHWKNDTTFKELIKIMIKHDLDILERGK